jgi:hypothetical protein
MKSGADSWILIMMIAPAVVLDRHHHKLDFAQVTVGMMWLR